MLCINYAYIDHVGMGLNMPCMLFNAKYDTYIKAKCSQTRVGCLSLMNL